MKIEYLGFFGKMNDDKTLATKWFTTEKEATDAEWYYKNTKEYQSKQDIWIPIIETELCH